MYKATENIRSFVLELLSCESVTLFLLDLETKMLRFVLDISTTLCTTQCISTWRRIQNQCRQSH